MSRRMIAARTIAYICCLCLCAAVMSADAQTGSSAPLSAQVRLPGSKGKTIDPIAPLGRAWGERALHDLLAALRIKGKPPVIPHDDINTHLQNRALGVELTFSDAALRDVPVPGVAAGTAVLSNIRLYGPGSRTHQPFKGDLPFGLRFGDTKDALLAKLGAPDKDILVGDFPLMRWDTERYALFLELTRAGGLAEFALQLPVVATKRPGFEAR
jgi:hypothetical protein